MRGYVGLVIHNLTEEDILRYYPFDSFRVNMLTPIKEKIAEGRQVVGLASPTGAGKTTFLAALALAAAETGVKSTILTATVANRLVVLRRLADAFRKAGDTGVRALVLYAKPDSCVTDVRPVLEALERLKRAEPGDYKWHALFYSRCHAASTSGACRFYVGASREEALSRVEAEVKRYPVATAAPPSVVRTEWPILNITELAVELGACPYELAVRLIERGVFDILVLDNRHILSLRRGARAEAFNPRRLVIVDEAHEYFFSEKFRITLRLDGGLRHALDRLDPELVNALLVFAGKMMDRYGGKSSMKFRVGETEYRYAVAEGSLDADLLRILESVVRTGYVKLHKSRRSARLEAELRLIQLLLELELSLASREDEVKGGATVVVEELRRGRRAAFHIVAAPLMPRLRPGRDFDLAIAASATLSPIHVSLVFRVGRGEASESIAPARWPELAERRYNLVLEADTYYDSRPAVANAVTRLARETGRIGIPLLLIASSTWIPLLREKLGDLAVLNPSGRRVEAVKEFIESAPGDGDVRILSPHFSTAKSVDLARPGEPFEALVVALSESIEPPDPDKVAEVASMATRYPWSGGRKAGEYLSWVTVFVQKAILKVIQAVGRFQRSEKHRLYVVYAGRFYKTRLPRYYSELYGRVDYAEASDPSEIPDRVLEWLSRVRKGGD